VNNFIAELFAKSENLPIFAPLNKKATRAGVA